MEFLTEIGNNETAVEIDTSNEECIYGIDNIRVKLEDEWIDLEDLIERYKHEAGIL